MDSNKQGFSLIEVALATMVVGVGLLAIFHLFPSGLNEAEHGIKFTRCTQFAEEVFATYGGRASAETNSLSAWQQVFAQPVTVGQGISASSGEDWQAIRYPDPSGTEWLQYKIYGSAPAGEPYRVVRVATKYGKAGGKQLTFFSSYFFHGM
jgi:prepilin-type N-terminal cleavage/methylation domain-containing protein